MDSTDIPPGYPLGHNYLCGHMVFKISGRIERKEILKLSKLYKNLDVNSWWEQSFSYPSNKIHLFGRFLENTEEYIIVDTEYTGIITKLETFKEASKNNTFMRRNIPSYTIKWEYTRDEKFILPGFAINYVSENFYETDFVTLHELKLMKPEEIVKEVVFGRNPAKSAEE